jgi:hypothetical protein
MRLGNASMTMKKKLCSTQPHKIITFANVNLHFDECIIAFVKNECLQNNGLNLFVFTYECENVYLSFVRRKFELTKC